MLKPLGERLIDRELDILLMPKNRPTHYVPGAREKMFLDNRDICQHPNSVITLSTSTMGT